MSEYKSSMMKKALPLLCSLILLCACSDETDPGLGFSDYIVFGTFYGECSGDCITLFRLSETRLERDTRNRFPDEDFQFISGQVLGTDDFIQARAILKTIPSELVNNPQDRYGCPDCRDQGGLYLNYRINGQTTALTIDPDDTDDQSEAIIRFKDELLDLVWALRN